MVELTASDDQSFRWKAPWTGMDWRTLGEDMVRDGMAYRGIGRWNASDFWELVEDRKIGRRCRGTKKGRANRLYVSGQPLNLETGDVVDEPVAFYVDEQVKMPEKISSQDSVRDGGNDEDPLKGSS